MPQARIKISRTKDKGADHLFVFIDDDQVAFENSDEAFMDVTTGERWLTAFLLRLNGSAVDVSGSVTVTHGTTELIKLPVEILGAGEASRSHAPFDVA